MKTLSLLILLTGALGAQDRADVLRQDIESAIQRLGSTRYTESYLARVELAEIGRPAVAAVVAELKKSGAKPAVKRALCEILGEIRDPRKEVVDVLTEKLKDYDEYGTSIAAAAARALASVGDESCVPALLAALTSSRIDLDKVLKYECIRALGLFRATRAAEALQEALKDTKYATVISGDQDAPIIAAAAAEALGRTRAKGASDALAELLSNTTQDPPSGQTLAVHAARALRKIHDAELKGKKPEDDARAGVLSGDAAEVRKTVDAWKEWWAGIKDEKDIAATKKTIAAIAAAVEAYKKGQGKYPEIFAYLSKAPDNATNYPKDGYYKGEIVDAWGGEIKYTFGGTGAPYDVVSFGKDGKPLGKDAAADIYNHDKWKAVLMGNSKKAVEDTVKVIEKFKADQDRYPTRLVDLVSRPTSFTPKTWPEGGYLKAVPKDGWGNYLIYRNPGTGGEAFDLISYGADKAEGGVGIDEDVWNHDKRPEKKKKEEEKKDDGQGGK